MLEALDWPEIVGALLLTTAAGTRAAGWLRARWKWVVLVVRTIERLTGSSVTVSGLKHELDRQTAEAGGEVRAFAESAAALAERAASKTGKATEKKAVTKLARWGRGIARWAPIIGAFL